MKEEKEKEKPKSNYKYIETGHFAHPSCVGNFAEVISLMYELQSVPTDDIAAAVANIKEQEDLPESCALIISADEVKLTFFDLSDLQNDPDGNVRLYHIPLPIHVVN